VGAERAGVGLMPLFQDARENVRLESWAPDAEIVLPAPGGLELLVLDGGFTEAGKVSIRNRGSDFQPPRRCGPEPVRAAAGSGSRQATSPAGKPRRRPTEPDSTAPRRGRKAVAAGSGHFAIPPQYGINSHRNP
jgi:hypothetical protein